MRSRKQLAIGAILATCLIILPLISGSTERSHATQQGQNYASAQILVKFKSPVAPARAAQIHARYGNRVLRSITRLGIRQETGVHGN